MRRIILFSLMFIGIIASPPDSRGDSLCRVSELLAPLEKGGELIPGQMVDGFYHEDGTVRIQMVDQESGAFWTLFLEGDRGRDAAGRAGGLVVLYSNDLPSCGAQEASVQELIRRIDGYVDSGGAPTDCLNVAPGEAPTRIVNSGGQGGSGALRGVREWFPLVLPWALVVGLVCLLGLERRRARAFFISRSRRWRFLWLGSGAVALMLGLWLVPHGPIHANHHGITELNVLTGDLVSPSEQSRGPLHGEVTRALMTPLTLIFGGRAEVVFGFGLLNLALFPLLMGLWIWRWGAVSGMLDRGRASLIGAWLAATWPVALRLGPTESPHLFALNCTLICGLAIDALCRCPGWRRLVFAVLVGALTVRIRIQPIAWVLMAGLWVLSWHVFRVRWRWICGLCATVAVVCTDHLMDVYRGVSESLVTGSGVDALSQIHNGEVNLLLTTDWTSALVVVLILVGIAGLYFRALAGDDRLNRMWILVGVLVCALGFLVVSHQISNYGSARVRYQVVSALWWIPLAVLGVETLLSRWAVRGWWVAGGIGLGYLIGSYPGMQQLVAPDMETQEWVAFSAFVEDLPPEAILVLPPHGVKTREAFPVAMLERRHEAVTIRSAGRDGEIPQEVWGKGVPVFYVRTLSCSLPEVLAPPCQPKKNRLELVREYTLRERVDRGSDFYRFPFPRFARVALYRVSSPSRASQNPSPGKLSGGKH